METALRIILKNTADTLVQLIGRWLPIRLVAKRQLMLLAIPSFQLPPPRNASQIPLAYLSRFDSTRSLPERYFHRLRNVQVSWHGVVFKNLQLYRSSVMPVWMQNEFNGSFLLRQWWKRKSSIFPGQELLALVFGPWAVGNYYHWMIDTLPRLLLLRQFYPDCRLLVPVNLPAYVAETIAIFGFTRLVPMQLGKIMKVPQLVMPDYTAMPGYQDFALLPEVQTLLLAGLGCQALPPGRPGRRVYVSRSKQQVRRLANEVEIKFLLQHYCFEVVYFEELSLAEQAQLLLETDVLMGIHGAGFTNALFMRPQTKVIELLGKTHFNPCYYQLCGSLNLEYYCLLCCIDSQQATTKPNPDLLVDVAALTQLLATL